MERQNVKALCVMIAVGILAFASPFALAEGANDEELDLLGNLLYQDGDEGDLLGKVREELLVRQARKSLTDKRPMSELTPMQKEGRRGAIKGARNELAVVHALSDGLTPVWLLGARICTEEEDAQGIDVVVETDIGPVYLQVKSSYDNAKKFLRRWPQRNVGMVVVRPQDDQETIFNKALDSAAKQRSQVLKA